MDRFSIFEQAQLTQGADGKWSVDESKPKRKRCRRVGDLADLACDGSLRDLAPGEYSGRLAMTRGRFTNAAGESQSFLSWNLTSVATPATVGVETDESPF